MRTQRWGSYAAIDVDPLDGETFWGATMVVDEDGWWKPCVVAFHVSRTWPLAPTAASWFRGAPTGGDHS